MSKLQENPKLIFSSFIEFLADMYGKFVFYFQCILLLVSII